MKSIRKKTLGLLLVALLTAFSLQPIIAPVSASQASPLCSQLDLLHGLVINGTGPNSYNEVNGSSLWKAACAQSPPANDVTSYTENRTLLDQNYNFGISFSETAVQYSMTQSNGVVTAGTMYETVYSAHQRGYNFTLMSLLLGGNVVTSINYVPTSGQSGTYLGDDIFTTTNVTLGQYFGLVEHGVWYLAQGYLSSGDASLQVLGQRYVAIALNLNILQHLVSFSPISHLRVTDSSTLIVDSSTSCLACELFVQSAILGGCFALCFFSLATLCGICAPLIDLAMELGAHFACDYFGYCP